MDGVTPVWPDLVRGTLAEIAEWSGPLRRHLWIPARIDKTRGTRVHYVSDIRESWTDRTAGGIRPAKGDPAIDAAAYRAWVGDRVPEHEVLSASRFVAWRDARVRTLIFGAMHPHVYCAECWATALAGLPVEHKTSCSRSVRQEQEQ